MRNLRHALVLFIAATALSGCTLVPTANAPERASQKDSFGLLGKTIPGTNNGRVRFITQPVYIVDATGHLAPSSRIVPSPPSLDSVLGELTLGPTDIETAAGYTSSLPKNLIILQAYVKARIGYVSLSTSLADLPRAQEILAIGQLVLTAHDVGATDGLEILVGGVAQALPLPSGERSHRVTVSDYKSLLNA
jgi:hypothetical protein